MDTSPQYIKLCEKAEEIQGDWKPSAWDWCYCKIYREVVILSGYETDAGYYGHGIEESVFEPKWQAFCAVEEGGIKSYKEQESFKLDHAWLPTQSQLQEMVGDYQMARDYIWGIGSNLDNEPYLFKGAFSEGYILSFNSMEQLWLAFVMKEKYGKIWNGTDWVK